MYSRKWELTIHRSRRIFSQNQVQPRKRKSPGTSLDSERRPSPFDRRLQQNADGRTPSLSRSPSVSSSAEVAAISLPTVYNGILDSDEHGFVFCRPVSVSVLENPTSLIAAGIRTRGCFRLHYRLPYSRNETSCIRVESQQCQYPHTS